MPGRSTMRFRAGALGFMVSVSLMAEIHHQSINQAYLNEGGKPPNCKHPSSGDLPWMVILHADCLISVQ